MARDFFHNAVRVGLQKEGWQITHDPLTLKWGGAPVQIDLGAERLIAAEQGNQKIAVEIKSFVGKSAISEFHTAVGQYLNYRIVLRELEPERVLYLAVSVDVFETFFDLKLPRIGCLQPDDRGATKMAIINNQQAIVQRVLTDYLEDTGRGATQLICDTERDHYQLVNVEWRNQLYREYGTLVHIDIIDGKFWIQWDGTEGGFAEKLLEKGVAKSDIVLAFHAPYKRKFTEFAVG